MIYMIPFEPVPMKYHRFGKNSRAYNPQARFKEQVRNILTLQHGNRKLYSGPLKFEVTYYMPIPASYSDKKKHSVTGTYHYSKPDTSNLQKLIEDCCSKIIFHDDAQISVIVATKKYDAKPRTEFTIRELYEENP
jgi:Holliday junction resolvase RusA-like endonuclease